MQIIAGDLRGQPITQPKSRLVRPLSDKVRQALFNIVGSVEGVAVLDAYAGSGAVGFEALSHGAELVEAVETNRNIARVIEQNVRGLGVEDRYQLWVMPIAKWLASHESRVESHRSEIKYDLIVADPPYAMLDAVVLEKLGELLKVDGVMVVSHASRLAAPEVKNLKLERTYKYGDSSLSVYTV